MCSVLYRHLQVFSGDGRAGDSFTRDLVDAITFCESESLEWFCSWAEVDPEVYLERSRGLFRALPKGIQRKALIGARKKWKEDGQHNKEGR